MEDQVQDAEAIRQVSNQDQTEAYTALGDKATDEGQDEDELRNQPGTETRDGEIARESESSHHVFEDDKESITSVRELASHGSRHRQPIETHTNDADVPEVVYLCDHVGSRYVFPFEQCSSKEDIEPLWREIYAESDGNYVEKINQGTYTIENPQGANILPSAWNTLVTPGSTIRISFVDHSRSSPQPESPLRLRLGDTLDGNGTDSPRVLRTVTFEEPQPALPSSRSESVTTTASDMTDDFSKDDSTGEDSTDYESSESEMSSSEEIPLPKDSRSPRIPRRIVAPVDAEGKVLSFHAQIKQSRRRNIPNQDSKTQENRKAVGKSDVEIRKITKAMMTEFEGRNVLQIYTLPGPENARLQEGVETTWYHLHASRLDFEKFQDVCLAVPGLSDRLLALTRALLTKVHTEKVKPFLGGRFIEPGTVLRVDEPDGSDCQPVIFSCVPYLSLEPPEKRGQEANSSLFPPHTLMQAMYLYESVRERDEEQSCRKFSDDRSGNVVHVPNLWIMNIGSGVVVTCGHRPLSSYMEGSINVIEEDIKPTSRQDVTKNPLTSIAITDQSGQTLRFPVGSCRSYFQMEAIAYELAFNHMTKAGLSESKFHLRYKTSSKSIIIHAEDWREIINRAADYVSINITLSEGPEIETSAKDAINGSTSGSATSTPPFFQWPDSYRDDPSRGGKKPTALGKPDKQPSTYLEQVEAAMLSEILDPSETTDSGIDNAFTSTDYYQSLPERGQSEFHKNLADLKDRAKRATRPTVGATFHQTIVSTQSLSILEKSIELIDIAQKTLKLWVNDLDSACVLCKLAGALDNVREWAVVIDQRGSIKHYPEEYLDANGKHPATTERTWAPRAGYVLRTGYKPFLLSVPDGDTKLARSVARCKRCQYLRRYPSPQVAFEHLQRHTRLNRLGKPGDMTEKGSMTASSDHTAQAINVPKLTDWVMSPAHFWLEHTNAGTLEILTQACAIANVILVEAKEIADGVQNEDGRMSSLYSLPKELVEAFRRILVFYMAIERALWQTRQIYDDDAQSGKSTHLDLPPYSHAGLQVLEQFGNGAKLSLFSARYALKQMAKSDIPIDISKHLSLGPEYTCAWLMRRLVVKPLEESRTAGDMYRKYVSKVFEVNHRPSKRLVRAINLIQEELQILISVNKWQTTLAQNYLSVLDDSSYGIAILSRQGMFPYERILVETCLDLLSLAREDYIDLISRCTPLSDRTKQMLEINEEDHGKAIMVFTVVTVIFLPLSFVTSYFGMNASDIRDMDQKQGLFWSVAIPLTVATVGSCLLIGYNGNELRDMISSFYRKIMGKEKRTIEAYGMGVAQRKRTLKFQSGSSSRVNSFNPADEAEFASPRLGLQRRPYDFEANDDWYDSPYNPVPLNRLPPPPAFRPMPMPSSDESRYFLESDGLKNRKGFHNRGANPYDDIYTAPRDQNRTGYDQYRYARRSSIDNLPLNPPPVQSVHIPPPPPPPSTYYPYSPVPLLIGEGERDERSKKEYAFARKKSRSRSRSNNQRGQVSLGDMFFR